MGVLVARWRSQSPPGFLYAWTSEIGHLCTCRYLKLSQAGVLVQICSVGQAGLDGGRPMHDTHSALASPPAFMVTLADPLRVGCRSYLDSDLQLLVRLNRGLARAAILLAPHES